MPEIGDNDWGPLLVGDGGRTRAVGDAYTDGGPVLDEDLLDLLRETDLTVGAHDPLLDHACNLTAPAGGEPCAVHIVADDHRVGDKRTARGLDTVVTPVCGEEGT